MPKADNSFCLELPSYSGELKKRAIHANSHPPEEIKPVSMGRGAHRLLMIFLMFASKFGMCTFSPKKQAVQANSHPPGHHTYVSMAGGPYRLLVIFLMFVSKFGTCMAAGEGRSNPTVLLHLAVMVLAVLWICVFYFMVTKSQRGVSNKTQRSKAPKKVVHQPGPECVLNGRAVYVCPSRPSTLQLLPSSCTVCSLASTAIVSEHTSNSYAANAGFEHPAFPFHPRLLLPWLLNPLQPCVPAVMATGEPTPEVGVRNPQLLHRFSELVVVSGGSSPDPHSGSTKSREIGNRSFSRTVSFPCEGANIRSFNADAIGISSNEIVKDNSGLPFERGRSWREQQQAYSFIGGEEYHPFLDSASDSER